MKKLISLCVSISLLISFSAPLQAKGHSSRRRGSSSSSQSCPKPSGANAEMLTNPQSEKWKNADQVYDLEKWLKKNPACQRKYRDAVDVGSEIAREECTASLDAATKELGDTPKICAAATAVMKAVGIQVVIMYRKWDGHQYVYVQGNGNGKDETPSQNKRKGNGGDNTNIEQKVEEKVDDAEDDNKDNVLVLKFKHSVDTSFMVFGGKGKLSKQEEDWIKLLNEASSLNAKIKGVLKTAVDMYVNPDKYSSASKGVPAYVMQFLFMKYADLAESVEDLMPYVNYKCNGGKPDRCQQIRSFASEAVLMQLRFRDNFDEDGRGSLVDKYLIPECEKLKDEATGKSVFRGDTDNASAALDEAQKKCVQAKMRAYILVKGKKTVQRELETEFEAKLRNVKFQNTQANQAFSPLFVYLLAGYLSMSGTVSTATTAAVTKASITAYTTEMATTAYSAVGGTSGILELAAPIVEQSSYNIISASSIQTVGEVASAVGTGTMATIAATATIALTSSGLMVYGLYDAYSASYSNAVGTLKASLRSAIRSAAKINPGPLNPGPIQNNPRINPGDQRPLPPKDDSRPKDPKKDSPDDEDKNKPRCQDEVKGRETCEFHFAVASEWELKDIGGWQGEYNGISTPGGINGGDAPSKQRRADLLTCLIQAGVCKGFPETNKKLRSPELFWRQCDGNENKPLKTIASMAPACARDLMELAEVGRVSKSFRSSRTHRVIDNVRAVYRHGKWIPEPEIVINNLIDDITFDSMVGYGGIARYGEHEQKGDHFHYEEMKLYEGKKDYVCNHTLPLDRANFNNQFGQSSGYTPCKK